MWLRGDGVTAMGSGSGREPLSERSYEMLWDCTYCGAAKLLAKTQRFCPQCGAPQDPNTRYFPDEADKVEVVGHRYEGVDKICAACQSPNGALAEFCGRCGAPLSDAARARRLSDQVRAEGGKFAASPSFRQQAAEQRRTAVPGKQPTARKRGYGGIVAAVVLGLIGLVAVVLLFWTRDETVEVAGHTWRQAIQIERYGPVDESAWCDQVPGGAYGVSRHAEVRSHRQVPDGRECQMRRVDRGDGTFTEREECRPKYRSEPVYDQRCEYRIDRWRPERTAVAEGRDLSPRWPETGVSNNGRPCLGCEREGPRDARYELLLKGQGTGREYRCALPLERWRAAGVETRWTLKVGAVDRQPRCDSLRPAD
jgi:hypothetical protein